MAILTSYKVPGDPHELLARDRETSGRCVGEIAVKAGQIIQFIVDEGDGMRLFHRGQIPARRGDTVPTRGATRPRSGS